MFWRKDIRSSQEERQHQKQENNNNNNKQFMVRKNYISVLDNFPLSFDVYNSSLKCKPPHSTGKK